MADLNALMTSARTGEKSKDLWCSPLWLYGKLDEEFRFKLDVAATKDNALCYEYFDTETNGLAQEWYGNCWCNPPYSTAAFWYKKAWSEAVLGHATTVMLVAARTDTRYWWDYAIKGEIRFLKGRLKFEGNGGKYAAPFPSALVIFHRDIQLRTPSVVFWNIKELK